MTRFHEMTFVINHSDAEEWYCDICSRRVLFRWQPYDSLILEHGDETVAHTGSTDNINLTVTRTLNDYSGTK